jgi:phage repressor protein C with HTH and peptisase S24 domain
MSDAERINYILLGLNTNKNRLGVSLGDKNGMRLTHVTSGRNGISEELARDISRVYPSVDYKWLLTGEGEPPKLTPIDSGSTGSNASQIAAHDEPTELELIRKIDQTEFRYLDEERYMIICPLVSQYAYAGYVSGYADPEYIEELPRHSIIVNELRLGSYRSFEVKGDSMDNGLKGCYAAGDVVTAKLLQKKYWGSPLHLHRYKRFVIISDEGIVIKEVVKHDVEKGILTLHSLNEMYDDYEVNLKDVQQIFYVIANTEKSKA